MDVSDFKVAIIGGGIGGLTTALSIAHFNPGIQIDVYEQAPQYAEIGAGVGIGVNAGRILRKLDVYDAANGISGERNNIHRTMRRWDNGDEISTQETGDNEEVRQLSVHRAEFLDVLLNAARERGAAKLHTSKRLVKIVVCCKTLVEFVAAVLREIGWVRHSNRLLRRWHISYGKSAHRLRWHSFPSPRSIRARSADIQRPHCLSRSRAAQRCRAILAFGLLCSQLAGTE